MSSPEGGFVEDNLLGEAMVRLRGKLFPYRVKAPFTPSGKSILGGVEYDPQADKVRCHECGEWFESITGHVHQHRLSTGEYRIRHGLRSAASLVNQRIRGELSARAKRAGLGRTCGFVRGTPSVQKKARQPLMLEYRNERGTCPAQTLRDLKELGSKSGHAPTEREMRAAGMHSRSARAALQVSTQAELAQKIGLPAVGRGRQRAHSREALIESLKNFVATHERMPATCDYGTRGLPFKGVYVKEFGGMALAYAAAGLQAAAQRECVRGRHRGIRPLQEQASEPHQPTPAAARNDRISESDRQELLRNNLTWAEGIARSVHRKLPPSFDIEDLMQEARVALWRFIEEKYDPRLNDNVQGAAYKWVSNAVRMKCRRNHFKEATHEQLMD